jgi:hypothetical protein
MKSTTYAMLNLRICALFVADFSLLGGMGRLDLLLLI